MSPTFERITMKITVKESTIAMLEKFLGFLTQRANDPIHDTNREMIADFVEKFLVVELKLPASDKPFDHDIEIPDDVYKLPMEAAQKQLDLYKAFMVQIKDAQLAVAGTIGQFMKDGVVLPASDKFAAAQISSIDQGLAQSGQTAAFTRRNGNGHKANKVRDLENSEKDLIKSEFLKLNGQITEDACLPIHQQLDPLITIFQVTGFVSYLHNKVAAGALAVKDLHSYLAFLQGHRDLWATYNNAKNIALRSSGKK